MYGSGIHIIPSTLTVSMVSSSFSDRRIKLLYIIKVRARYVDGHKAATMKKKLFIRKFPVGDLVLVANGRALSTVSKFPA